LNARLVRAALLAALALGPLAARADFGAAEVAEAERLRVEEAARARDYRERVARGDVRGAAAPMPRQAPQTPETSPGDALRGAAEIVDLIERLLGQASGERRREEDSR
jgi:hypothetical protein